VSQPRSATESPQDTVEHEIEVLADVSPAK